MSPPRWIVPYEHHRGDPFVDLALPEPERLGRDLKRGIEHWRDYAGCTPARHRRRRCHHHAHPELAYRYRGQGRGRRGKEANRVELAWKRTEGAEHHARFGQWLTVHMDRPTRYVGKVDSAGELVPYRLEEIAEDLRRPGEAALPLDVLEEVINAFDAGKLIHRWQGRNREIDDAGNVKYSGKVAIIRCSHDFLIRTGMAALRQQRLEQDERRRQKAERRAERDAEISAVVRDAANARAAEKHAPKIRRQVMADHPEWVRQDRQFAIEEEIDRRLQVLFDRQREARRRPPPTRP